jgi:murein DD-endopeptidase MepM/ murein hydrolase activator NlpD
MVGQAFTFDGVDDYLQAPTNGLPQGNGDRTLELWVKIDAFVAGEAFFAGYGSFGSSLQTYHLGTENWHNMVFFSTWIEAIAGPVLQPGVWYHVAVTNTGNTAILYLNGTQVASGDLGINTPPDTSFYVGQIPGDSFRRLQGQVDEVSVYNRALTPDEIQAIANAGSAGKCPLPPTPPAWRLPWEYGTSWYFNGGPHDWSDAAPGTCVDPPDNCSGTASGIDFGPTADDKVYAMADGIVYFAGPQTYGTCGAANVVKIRHSGGWETWYLHLATFAPGIEGATSIYVQQGRLLGRAGATGVCGGGVHLHVELCGGLPDGVDCTQDYHQSWDGQVVDGWTIHADCDRYTDPPNCSATNYDNYMSKDSTQVLPCVPRQTPPECTRRKVGESHNPTYIPLLWVPFSLEQGGTSVFVISVATGQQRMHVSWQWGGSTVDGWLTAPDGSVIDSATIDPNVAYSTDATSAYYEITDPQAGDWTVHLFGADVPDGPEPVLVAAGSVSAPVGPVGGIAELADTARAVSLHSAPSKPPYAALAAGLTAALAALTAGVWYARRRRHKA